MKRMHIHLGVADLAASIAFYTKLFDCPPAVEKPDYAKWMLEDPRINFAISTRGAAQGLDHLGLQVDSDEELGALRGQLDAAGMAVVSQTGTTCCYAQSDKHWVTDPDGTPWETYHTLGSAPVFGAHPAEATEGACCAPAAQVVQILGLSSRKEAGK